MPPLNPATAANAKLFMKGMGSPFGLNVFLPTFKKVVHSILIITVFHMKILFSIMG